MVQAYVEIYRPVSQQEIIMIKLLLERERIRFFITNEGVAGLFQVSGIGLGDMRLLVEAHRAAHALEILQQELDLPLDAAAGPGET